MIYQAAKSQDHSLADLGRGCNLNRSQISRFIGGTRNVTSAQLAAIFDYLAIEVFRGDKHEIDTSAGTPSRIRTTANAGGRRGR